MNELTGAIPAHLRERPERSEPKNAMGKDDFMTLLMAQLKHQDPLNPMDHKEFSAQLAQFAQLEKLTQIGTGIQKLEGGMGEEAKLQALNMIGKRVKAGGAEVTLIENQPVDIRMSGEAGFRPLKVSIYGGDGKLVRQMDLDPRAEMKSVTWDGLDDEGMAAKGGKYYFRVAGVGADGKSKEMELHQSGKVIGVEMKDNSPMLVIDTGASQSRVELSKVQTIGNEESEKKPTPGSRAAPAQEPSQESQGSTIDQVDPSSVASSWPRSFGFTGHQQWGEEAP